MSEREELVEQFDMLAKAHAVQRKAFDALPLGDAEARSWQHARLASTQAVLSGFIVQHCDTILDALRSHQSLKEENARHKEDVIAAAAMRVTEACSDSLLGGEHGWENLIGTKDFDGFLQRVRWAASTYARLTAGIGQIAPKTETEG